MAPEDIAQIATIVAAAEQRLSARLDAGFDQAEQRAAERLEQAEQRSQEFTRQVETNLLTALHAYGKGQTAPAA